MDTNRQMVIIVGLLFVTFAEAASTIKNTQPSCRQSDIDSYVHNLTLCECSGDGLISTSCDFSALPNNVSLLNVGALQLPYNDPNTMAKCSTTNGNSVLDANAIPLAHETRLKYIQFCSFDFDTGGPERVNVWLANVKHSLRNMVIQEGKLTTLQSSFLAGFEKLYVLTIARTGLKLIEPGAFGDMGTRPSFGILVVMGNKLETFDWVLLQAVAPTFTALFAGNNSISTMQMTSSVRFPKLSYVDLRENKLTEIPRQILYMWANGTDNARSEVQVNLQRNPLCPAEDCRCSSLIPLFSFNNQNPENMTRLRMDFDCGDVGHKWDSTQPHNFGACYKRQGFGRFLSNGVCKQFSDTEDFSPELSADDDQTHPRPKTVSKYNYDNFAYK